MSTAFDPYHRWLGIRPEEQPADHYRLLGLVRFEDDLEVIRDAAERQMGHVRHYALGQHRDLSQKILNELGAARAGLLDPAKKVRYDAELRAAAAGPLPPEPPPQPPPAETVPDWEPTFVSVAPRPHPTTRAAPERSSVKATRQRRETKTNRLQITPKHLLIAGIAAGLVVLVASLLTFKAEPDVPLGTEKPTEKSDPAELRTVPATPKTPVATDTEREVTPEPKSEPKPEPGKVEPPKTATRPEFAVAPFDTTKAKEHQAGWAKHLGVPVETTNSIGMKLALIPAGEFMMGAPEDEKERSSDEGPVHRVRITQPFYLGVYEVTQAEHEKIMGTNPSRLKESGGTAPVEQVSWEEAQEFCRKLSSLAAEQAAGRHYRLPTEAEWEYACRAGTTMRYSFDESKESLDSCAWYGENSGDKTHPVGQKRPNAFGLYDMHGNVWEWCADWYGPYSSGVATDPEGSGPSAYRVYRGGSWCSDAGRCRSANRDGYSPGYRFSLVGFRLAVVRSGR